MELSALSTDQLHAVAAHLALAEVIIQTQLPAEVKPEERRYRLRVDGKLVQVISRRTGDWQVTDVHHPLLPDTDAVILADFIPASPEFYVVPADPFRQGVTERHAEFMARVRQRPKNPDSRHHRVRTIDVAQWLGCWDVLLKPAS
jgi:hypothetical protein